MTVMRDGLTATLLDGAGVDLGRVNGEATLDESWAPHVQATLTIAQPDEETLQLLDARDNRRIRLDSTASYPGSFIADRARAFNLGIRDSELVHGTGELQLSLASDEALLMDDVLTGETPNTAAIAHQASVRALINNVVLSRIGAALEAGATDAPLYLVFDTTNLITNPSLEANITGWGAGGGASALQSISGTSLKGAACARWTAAAGASDAFPFTGINTPASAGKQYTFSTYLHSSISRVAGVVLRFYAADASTMLAQAAGPTAATATTSWKRFSVTATAPPGTAFVFGFITTAGNTAGQFHFADCAMLNEGPLTPYFDGSGAYADPSAADYAFSWTGTPNNSTSRRTAGSLSRSPDMLTWRPGVSAWAFIQPLFQSLGFRLYCDEARKWHLVDGVEFVAPGMLQLTMPGSLHQATDRISRDGDWFDAAIARYRWTDATGVSHERIDSYAPLGSTRVRVFEIEAPYPGPGFARYAVTRAEGRGREAELVALSNLTVSASQMLRVNLPDTPELIGVVRRVVFDLTDGTMQIASRGLTDVPDGAWALVDPDLTWAAAPAVAWSNWINPEGD
ncbi:hypothetical protein [Agromyces sp. CCNWLW203]|uniref:hypothetical protein n=1 Tax=Agromyces sp. CCNWLW203 TaxID=3112842 RepID=UPI002F9654FF